MGGSPASLLPPTALLGMAGEGCSTSKIWPPGITPCPLLPHFSPSWQCRSAPGTLQSLFLLPATKKKAVCYFQAGLMLVALGWAGAQRGPHAEQLLCSAAKRNGDGVGWSCGWNCGITQLGRDLEIVWAGVLDGIVGSDGWEGIWPEAH